MVICLCWLDFLYYELRVYGRMGEAPVYLMFLGFWIVT